MKRGKPHRGGATLGTICLKTRNRGFGEKMVSNFVNRGLAYMRVGNRYTFGGRGVAVHKARQCLKNSKWAMPGDTVLNYHGEKKTGIDVRSVEGGGETSKSRKRAGHFVAAKSGKKSEIAFTSTRERKGGN